MHRRPSSPLRSLPIRVASFCHDRRRFSSKHILSFITINLLRDAENFFFTWLMLHCLFGCEGEGRVTGVLETVALTSTTPRWGHRKRASPSERRFFTPNGCICFASPSAAANVFSLLRCLASADGVMWIIIIEVLSLWCDYFRDIFPALEASFLTQLVFPLLIIFKAIENI